MGVSRQNWSREGTKFIQGYKFWSDQNWPPDLFWPRPNFYWQVLRTKVVVVKVFLFERNGGVFSFEWVMECGIVDTRVDSWLRGYFCVLEGCKRPQGCEIVFFEWNGVVKVSFRRYVRRSRLTIRPYSSFEYYLALFHSHFGLIPVWKLCLIHSTHYKP